MFKFEREKEPFKLRPGVYETCKRYRKGDLEALGIIVFFALVALAMCVIVTKESLLVVIIYGFMAVMTVMAIVYVLVVNLKKHNK